jgi:hypothetical protein
MRNSRPPIVLSRAARPAPRLTWRRVLPWLPLALILFALLVTALRVPIVPSSEGATTDSGTVTINGFVDKDVQIDGSACVGGALNLGLLTPGDPMVSTASDCTITFSSSNSPAGADLVIQESPVTANNAMQCAGGTCAADTVAPNDGLNDFSGATYVGQTGSNFGMRLMSSANAASAVWAVNPQTYAVDAASTACQTASQSAGDCAFRFAASASATTDLPGTYQANVDFVAQAR